MNTEIKRIFISDLPETLTKEELENNFSKYGQVSSVEIKERKELGPHNSSLFFAYINLITNDRSLNQCFRDLSNTKWHGKYVQLQIARESFLERLKRERQEKETAQNITPQKHEENLPKRQLLESSFEIKTNSKKLTLSKKSKSISESEKKSSESDSDSTETKNSLKLLTNEPEEELDIIVKNNKNKIIDKNSGLKIPSVGNSPIIEITKPKKNVRKSDNEANKKRLQSLQEMKKSYATQKSLIKSALTMGAEKTNNKIIFGDEHTDTTKALNGKRKINGLNQKSLFEDDNEEDPDFEVNFNIKEQFQGKSGQKLLELKSKYMNDKRFTLDARFMEVEEGENNDKEIMDTEENLKAEKNEQLKILEEVLGKKVVLKSSNTKKDSSTRKTMLKFDPSQPEHSNFELTIAKPEKKKKKEAEPEVQKPEPEVSKEVFYKVPEKLKETFAEKPSFSLLSIFENTTKENNDENQEGEKEIKRNSLLGNPFKYDSSDDEDEIEDIPHKSTTTTSETKISEPLPCNRTNSQTIFWTESFFFKNDDFRLQEGLDFLEKIKSEDKDFLKIRKELKEIVKAKVRNTERKNRMFKKKIGGSKRRKHIRIKKALKR